jgi:hypothetical protein
MATLQLKRGSCARWFELNPVLAAGEPGFEYDTKKLKIGDGVTAWNDLPYIGSNDVYCTDEYVQLPAVGDANRIYKVSNEKTLYQWNTTEAKYESLSSGESFSPSEINLIYGGTANG